MGLTGFQKEILAAIRTNRPLTAKRFDALALETFTWQYDKNPVYRRWVNQYGNPRPAGEKEITPLPITVFKYARVLVGGCGRPKGIFKTSGTTQGERRGKHIYPSLVFYDAVIESLFSRFMLKGAKRIRMVSLLASSRENPHSSLSYMADHAASRFAKGRVFRGVQKGEIRLRGLVSCFKDAKEKDESVLLAATTLGLWGFLELLQKSGLRFELPRGSRILETGGMKGRRHQIPRRVLLQKIARVLSVSPEYVVNEYGMTELTTHFYDDVLRGSAAGIKCVPPWARVTAAPSAFTRPSGEQGLLRVTDLANQGSVAFVQTEDMGRIRPQGFEMRGRKPGADLRGCSLDYESITAAK